MMCINKVWCEKKILSWGGEGYDNYGKDHPYLDFGIKKRWLGLTKIDTCQTFCMGPKKIQCQGLGSGTTGKT